MFRKRANDNTGFGSAAEMHVSDAGRDGAGARMSRERAERLGRYRKRRMRDAAEFEDASARRAARRAAERAAEEQEWPRSWRDAEAERIADIEAARVAERTEAVRIARLEAARSRERDARSTDAGRLDAARDAAARKLGMRVGAIRMRLDAVGTQRERLEADRRERDAPLIAARRERDAEAGRLEARRDAARSAMLDYQRKKQRESEASIVPESRRIPARIWFD